MTMLSTTGEHVVYVIMFWLVQLEVSLCEDMFGSLDGKTSLAYPAIWPRPPTETLRRLLPNVADEWCRKAGVRWLVARAGLAAGVVAAAAPPLRAAATPAFLVIYAAECYCFFVKFGAHMHFAPLLLHAREERDRDRGAGAEHLLVHWLAPLLDSHLWLRLRRDDGRLLRPHGCQRARVAATAIARACDSGSSMGAASRSMLCATLRFGQPMVVRI